MAPAAESLRGTPEGLILWNPSGAAMLCFVSVAVDESLEDIEFRSELRCRQHLQFGVRICQHFRQCWSEKLPLSGRFWEFLYEGPWPARSTGNPYRAQHQVHVFDGPTQDSSRTLCRMQIISLTDVLGACSHCEGLCCEVKCEQILCPPISHTQTQTHTHREWAA